MKKLILLLSVIALLTSCETKNVEIKSTDMIIEGRTIRTYIIDSCEYIGYIYGGHGDFLTHRGNCQFCERRRTQEIETLKNN